MLQFEKCAFHRDSVIGMRLSPVKLSEPAGKGWFSLGAQTAVEQKICIEVLVTTTRHVHVYNAPVAEASYIAFVAAYSATLDAALQYMQPFIEALHTVRYGSLFLRADANVTGAYTDVETLDECDSSPASSTSKGARYYYRLQLDSGFISSRKYDDCAEMRRDYDASVGKLTRLHGACVPAK